jgi:hypothetical protein
MANVKAQMPNQWGNDKLQSPNAKGLNGFAA